MASVIRSSIGAEVTSIQWTGGAKSEIRPPGDLATFYQTRYKGDNYNKNTNKLTLDFRTLPDSLTYCIEPKNPQDYSNVRNPTAWGSHGSWLCTFRKLLSSISNTDTGIQIPR